MSDEGWMMEAECLGVNPAIFFPEKGDIGRMAQAKAVCAECLVRDECLEYALEHGERYGIWGGMGVRERWKLRQQLPGRVNQARCGTRSGAGRHRDLGEAVCEACAAAERLAGRRRMRVRIPGESEEGAVQHRPHAV